jgi:hypothetical protein
MYKLQQKLEKCLNYNQRYSTVSKQSLKSGSVAGVLRSEERTLLGGGTPQSSATGTSSESKVKELNVKVR